MCYEPYAAPCCSLIGVGLSEIVAVRFGVCLKSCGCKAIMWVVRVNQANKQREISYQVMHVAHWRFYQMEQVFKDTYLQNSMLRQVPTTHLKMLMLISSP